YERDHGYLPTPVAFSPDGSRIAANSRIGTIRIWDANSGTLLHTLEHSGDHLAWSPDGQLLASISQDQRQIEIWDAATEMLFSTIPLDAFVTTSISWSPDGSSIATGAYRDVTLWDVATGSPTLRMRDYDDFAYTLAWSPDGSRIAGGGAESRTG